MLIMVTSCSKENTTSQNTFVGTVFEFSIQNEQGDDLLNPDVFGSYKHDDLEVYCLNNESKKLLANNESPNFISQERGFFTLFINLVNDSTYLKLSDSITDTIISETRFGDNYQYTTKIFLNDDLIWKKEDETSLIVIVK